MAVVFDGLLIVILLVNLFLGYKKGFVKTVFSCLSIVAAIILAGTFGQVAGEYLKTTKVFEKIEQNIDKQIDEHFEKMFREGIENAKPKAEQQASPLGELLSKVGVDTDELYEDYAKALKDGADNVKQDFAKNLSRLVLDALARIVGTIGVFVISLIALKLLCVVLDAVFKLPVLSALNKSFGILAGLLCGALVVLILCTAVNMAMPYIPKNPVIYPGMEKHAAVYRFFTQANPLVLLLFS